MKTILLLLFFSISAYSQVYYSSGWRDNESYSSDEKIRHSFINGEYTKSVYTNKYHFLYSLPPQKVFAFFQGENSLTLNCYSFTVYIKPPMEKQTPTPSIPIRAGCLYNGV